MRIISLNQSIGIEKKRCKPDIIIKNTNELRCIFPTPHDYLQVTAVLDDYSNANSSPPVEMSESERGILPDHLKIVDDGDCYPFPVDPRGRTL